jgi:histidine triad (HIT) family protein
MSPEAGCIFCRIVAGEAPAALLAESEDAVAFLDLFPVAEGHALVIPRAHYENLFEATEATLPAVHLLVRRVARGIRRALAPDGLMVTQLNGAAAGQTVFHYHAHLIPRRAGTPLQLHGRTAADPAALETVARRIRAALEHEP